MTVPVVGMVLSSVLEHLALVKYPGLPRALDSDIFAAQRQYAERRRALARLLAEVEGAAVSTDRLQLSIGSFYRFILLQGLVPIHHWHFHILVQTVLTRANKFVACSSFRLGLDHRG